MVKLQWPNEKNISNTPEREHQKRIMMGFRTFWVDLFDEENNFTGSGEGVVFSNGTVAYFGYDADRPIIYNSLSDLEALAEDVSIMIRDH